MKEMNQAAYVKTNPFNPKHSAGQELSPSLSFEIAVQGRCFCGQAESSACLRACRDMIGEAPGSYHTNRKYKDRLFRFLFREKKELLTLYNAVNGSSYTDPDALEINTLENVLYLSMKNDVSFLIDGSLNLYEEQSSWNPNMPLRGLLYFAKLYTGYIKTRHLDIYSRTQLSLPAPHYIVFYIGSEEHSEREELLLSSSFRQREGQKASLECVATVLNINRGHNEVLMNQCRKLYEYSFLVCEIREHLRKGLTLKAAIEAAVENCLSRNILTDFLLKHHAEVTDMILEEYSMEELHWEYVRREAEQKGLEAGRQKGLKEGRQEGKLEGQERVNSLNAILLDQKRFQDLQKATVDKDFQEQLFVEFQL